MRTQVEKGHLFRELHQRRGILILPNPWDAGTAKLLASLGFEALATTSLGMSNALGRVDGEGSVSRAELLENCRVIAEATDLPVNADLENGYADDPEQAATILRDAAEMGVVGGSIEDWSGERVYDFHHAVERVVAGVEMARSLSVPFTFVARAENLIRGRPDLDDTIKRLQAFDGIVEVRPAADQILGPRYESERNRQAAGHLDACHHTLDRVVEIIDALAAPILDRAPNNTHLRRVAQDGCSLLGIIGVTVFKVGVDRQVGRLRDDAAVLQKLGAADRALPVDAAQRVGHAEAGGRQRLKTKRRQQLRSAGVPRVGQNQNSPTLVQLPK